MRVFNYIFASVFANWTGYNVSIFEVDNINANGQFNLIESITSDMLSPQGIADIIKPYMPLEILDKMFIGVYINDNDVVSRYLRKMLSCKVGYLRKPQPKYLENTLCEIPIRITDGKLKVSPHLSGIIESDLMTTEPLNMPKNIASLAQIMTDWEALKNGGVYPNSGQSFTSRGGMYNRAY
jgi:hypothetical protein